MFKDITGWEDLYAVNEDGVVWSKKFKKPLAQHLNNYSYYKVDLFRRVNKKVVRKTAYVHRLVAEAFIPKEPGKDYIDHIDGNKLNNNVANLHWVTNSENVTKGYKENPNVKPKVKAPIVIEGTNKTFESIAECARFLGISYERCKAALRFWNGRLRDLGITIKRV